MDRIAYILDTNAISDYIKQFEPTSSRIRQAIRNKHILYLCEPVVYEVLRGLIKAAAVRQHAIFEEQFAPELTLLTVTETDWRHAAHSWADVRNAGRQLSDVDLLIAALAHRTSATIVTNDDDFDALPVARENWRVSTQS